MATLNPRQLYLQGLETTQKCWRYYVEFGWTFTRIAAELGITKGAVSRAIRRGEQVALDALKATISEHKAKALERLEFLYFEARDAWERSKGEVQRKRSKQKTAGDKGETTTELHTEERVGDARYLAEARMCIERMCKLLGLDAPQKVAVVDEDRPYQGMSEDDLDREMAAALKAAGVDPLKLAEINAKTPERKM